MLFDLLQCALDLMRLLREFRFKTRKEMQFAVGMLTIHYRLVAD